MNRPAPTFLKELVLLSHGTNYLEEAHHFQIKSESAVREIVYHLKVIIKIPTEFSKYPRKGEAGVVPLCESPHTKKI